MIEFMCDGCGAKFRVPDSKGGTSGTCPKCHHRLTIPSSTTLAKSTKSTQDGMNFAQAIKVLGLSSAATPRKARKAFRELAKRYHPDTGMNRSAEKFIEIVSAYEYLREALEPKPLTVPPPLTSCSPSGGLSYDTFVTELDAAVLEATELFLQHRSAFVERLRSLVDAQISSYSSASEFRNRLQPEVDKIIQRELWSFCEWLGRRFMDVERRFRSWVADIRGSAYEVELPHGVLEYLARPSGLVLSSAIFLVLTSFAYLAMFMSPLPFFDKGPVPILAGILSAVASGMIALFGGKALFMRSARKRGAHERALLMSAVGFDSFQVGAIPVSQALSSGERAQLAGTGMGLAAMWLSVEPVTGIIATGVATFLGWATGKSLARMQEQAKENLWTALQPRLEDFFDGFAEKLINDGDMQLQRMRTIYLESLGPATSPLIQRQRVSRPRLGQASMAGSGRNETPSSDRESLLAELREMIGGAGGSKIFIAPNIPNEKLCNAVDSYAQGTDVSSVLLLYDDTLWKSAKNGLTITPTQLFWRNMSEGAQRMLLSEVKVVHVPNSGNMKINGQRIDVGDKNVADVLARLLNRMIYRSSSV